MKLIILDRDGVINFDSRYYIKAPDEFIPIPGSIEAIAQLNHLGYQIAIATNQSGIARGLYDEKTLAAIHQKLRDELKKMGGVIDYISYCPHHPDEKCHCRKPAPGLLEDIANHFCVDLNKIPFIGDTLRDLIAGRNMGCKPILVKTGNGLFTMENHSNQLKDVEIYDDLKAYVDLNASRGLL